MLLNRLRTRQEFDLAFKGQVLAKTAHFALHAGSSETMPVLALGCVIPKRWAKRAVTRNLIKRQIFSVAQASLSDQWNAQVCVVRLRGRFDPALWTSARSQALQCAVQQELQDLFHRASLARERNRGTAA